VGLHDYPDRPDVIDASTLLLGWWLADSERQLLNDDLNVQDDLKSSCGKLLDRRPTSTHPLSSGAIPHTNPLLGSGWRWYSLGIADSPGDMADAFHTVFGVADTSLLGYSGLDYVDPVHSMPASLIERLGRKRGWKALPRRDA